MIGHSCFECGRSIRAGELCWSWTEESHSKGTETVFAHRDCDRAMLDYCAVLLPALRLARVMVAWREAEMRVA